jgi:hypothetical protein
MLGGAPEALDQNRSQSCVGEKNVFPFLELDLLSPSSQTDAIATEISWPVLQVKFDKSEKYFFITAHRQVLVIEFCTHSVCVFG